MGCEFHKLVRKKFNPLFIGILSTRLPASGMFELSWLLFIAMNGQGIFESQFVTILTTEGFKFW